MKDVNLLSTDEEQIAWCREQGIEPHKYEGDDCEICNLSIYMAIHTDAMPRLDR